MFLFIFHIIMIFEYIVSERRGIIMINKKNLWFLTLFSLVLVLSIYYVTMPNEIFDDDIDTNIDLELVDNDDYVNVEEVSVVSALKVEDDASVMEEINTLKEKLTSGEVSIDDKNAIFEELKLINMNSSVEETLESEIKGLCNCDNFVKIDGDNVRVVLDSDESSAGTANNIMRLVQSEFD